MQEKIKFTDASVRDAFSPSTRQSDCLSNEDERLWRRPTVKGRCRPGPSRCAIDNKGQAQPLLLSFHPEPASFLRLFLNGEFCAFLTSRRSVCASEVGKVLGTWPFVAGKKVACLLRDLLEKGGWVFMRGRGCTRHRRSSGYRESLTRYHTMGACLITPNVMYLLGRTNSPVVPRVLDIRYLEVEIEG